MECLRKICGPGRKGRERAGPAFPNINAAGQLVGGGLSGICIECLLWPVLRRAETCLLGQVAPRPSIAGFDGQTDRIGPGTHAKRGEYGSAVHLYRALAEPQFIGDLLV